MTIHFSLLSAIGKAEIQGWIRGNQSQKNVEQANVEGLPTLILFQSNATCAAVAGAAEIGGTDPPLRAGFTPLSLAANPGAEPVVATIKICNLNTSMHGHCRT